MSKKRKKDEKKVTFKESMYYFKRLWSYIKIYKLRVFVYILLSSIDFALGIIFPILLGKALVKVVEHNFNEFVIYCLAFLAVYLLDGILMATTGYMSSRIYEMVLENLRNDLYKKILNMPVEAFDKMKGGEVINRVTESASTVIEIMSKFITVGIRVVREIIIVVIVFFICREVFYIYMIMIVFIYLVLKKYGRKIKRITKSMKKNSDSYISNLQQTIQGIRELKSLGLKKGSLNKFELIVRVIKKKGLKGNDIKRILWFTILAAKIFVNGVVLIVAGYYVCIGKLLADYYLAIDNYTNKIMVTVDMVTEVGVDVQKVSVALERIFEILDNKLYPDEKFGNKSVEYIKGEIELKNILFAYDDTSEVLDNISIHIPKNKKIAIVGRSGSGKSTLFSLLLRFYDFESGEILIDGVNIKEFDEDSLRKHISVIRQEPFLFNSTIKQNLTMVKPTATTEELREACKIAYIDEYIMSLPKQYDTLIGEGGVNLSGGQKQRISIARAMLKKSKIMLFDEATSALDNESQYNVKKAIDEVAKDHTVIIIAHRLSTVIDCDEMILLDAGKVVARGTHEDLIKHNEVYNKLYNVDLING